MVKGTVYVGTQCVVLYPNTILGTVGEAHLANSPDNLVEEGVEVTVSSQTTSSVQDKVAAVDLTALTQDEQCQVRLLLQKYNGRLFSL